MFTLSFVSILVAQFNEYGYCRISELLSIQFLCTFAEPLPETVLIWVS